jgi:hypothetical protein
MSNASAKNRRNALAVIATRTVAIANVPGNRGAGDEN